MASRSRNTSKAAKYKIVPKQYKSQRLQRNASPSLIFKRKTNQKKRGLKGTKLVKSHSRVKVYQRTSKFLKRSTSQKSRQVSSNKKTRFKVLSKITDKVKKDQFQKVKKDRPHSSDLLKSQNRKNLKFPSSRNFQRSLPKRRQGLKTSTSKHHKNNKTCMTFKNFPKDTNSRSDVLNSDLLIVNPRSSEPGSTAGQLGLPEDASNRTTGRRLYN